MSEDVTNIIDTLSTYGSITVRKMFGGYGVYKEGNIIGIIDDDQLYFKSTPETEAYYQSFGSAPFIYEGKNRPVKMSYWMVPDAVIKDPTHLKQWVETAYQASLSSQKKKSAKR
ncbi:MAG: TfoX/Sxy family protein [Candidatus Paracaedibacteraceae bacterium]|nr:TfoX/Sxy family protein [Candidatus Paracaedibacteraceae bacterium]